VPLIVLPVLRLLKELGLFWAHDKRDLGPIMQEGPAMQWFYECFTSVIEDNVFVINQIHQPPFQNCLLWLQRHKFDPKITMMKPKHAYGRVWNISKFVTDILFTIGSLHIFTWNYLYKRHNSVVVANFGIFSRKAEKNSAKSLVHNDSSLLVVG